MDHIYQKGIQITNVDDYISASSECLFIFYKFTILGILPEFGDSEFPPFFSIEKTNVIRSGKILLVTDKSTLTTDYSFRKHPIEKEEE